MKFLKKKDNDFFASKNTHKSIKTRHEKNSRKIHGPAKKIIKNNQFRSIKHPKSFLKNVNIVKLNKKIIDEQFK